MKKLLETLKQKWAEYLLEMIVITAGILGAFGLNSWNQNRLDSKEEQRLLTLIHAEVNNYLWLQERGSERQENVLRSVERLLSAMKSPSDSLDMNQIDQDLYLIYTTRWFIGKTSTNIYDVFSQIDAVAFAEPTLKRASGNLKNHAKPLKYMYG